MLDQLATYEALKTDKQGTKTIAWVIGITLAVIAFALIWGYMKNSQDKANIRATDFAFATNRAIGVLEGNQATIGTIVANQSADIKQLLVTAASNTTEVNALGATLDKLVCVSAKSCNGTSATSGVNGIPRFLRTSKYNLCDSQLLENDACGNA